MYMYYTQFCPYLHVVSRNQNVNETSILVYGVYIHVHSSRTVCRMFILLMIVLLIFSRITEGLEESLPQLETLVLTSNSIQDLVRLW